MSDQKIAKALQAALEHTRHLAWLQKLIAEAQSCLPSGNERTQGAQEKRPKPLPGLWIAVQSENPAHPEEWDVREGGPGGYSVISYGFITEGQAKEIALRHNLTIPPASSGAEVEKIAREEWTPAKVYELTMFSRLHHDDAQVIADVHNAALRAHKASGEDAFKLLHDISDSGYLRPKLTSNDELYRRLEQWCDNNRPKAALTHEQKGNG